MTEPISAQRADDPQIALHRLAESLRQRFSEVGRAEIEELIRVTYEELKGNATAESHLVALTEGRVTEELRQRGETVHVRTEE